LPRRGAGLGLAGKRESGRVVDEKNCGVWPSGEGTNLEAILEAAERGRISAQVVLVISDRKKAPALERARRRGIEPLHLDPRPYRGAGRI